MAFQKAQVVKVENGYMVSLTQMDLTERGYVPTETHYIAEDIKKVIDLVLGETATPLKLV